MKNLLSVTCSADYCLLASRQSANEYLLQFCNGIGTTVDSKTTEIEPISVAMNRSFVFIASKQAIYQWQFFVARKSLNDIQMPKRGAVKEKYTEFKI